MDWIRRTADSYRRSTMINGATADDDRATPVAKLNEICELLRTSHGSDTVKEITELLLKRLDHNSPVVKHKALRLIKYAVGKSGEEFRKEMKRNSTVVCQLFHYKGRQDPLKGDALNKAVRDSAREAISAIFPSHNNKVVKSPNLADTHFISLPLVTRELINKLEKFRDSILGLIDVNKVNMTNKSSVSHPSKAPSSSEPGEKPSSLSDLGIERSMFINPRTFHLTVVMLKLWSKERVDAAANLLKSVAPKVLNALENRPVSVRLEGLACMKGSTPAEAWIVYDPVKEIGAEGRLLSACHAIIDAFVEAGLADKDAKKRFMLHATVMNAKFRKRGEKMKKLDSFDARGIFQKYGSMDWGTYLIREAHLSQRFAYDQNGYFHRCASIPFPAK